MQKGVDSVERHAALGHAADQNPQAFATACRRGEPARRDAVARLEVAVITAAERSQLAVYVRATILGILIRHTWWPAATLASDLPRLGLALAGKTPRSRLCPGA